MGLSSLIYGAPGTGKSSLIMTAPGPRLHIDTEGGGEWLAGKVIPWTDLGAIPSGIDANTTVTAPVVGPNAMATFQALFQWLVSGKHPFDSIGLDSISEMQNRVVEKQTPVGGGDPDWIAVQRIVKTMIRELHDLKFHPTKPISAILFVAGMQTNITEKKIVSILPALSGQLAAKIPHAVDVCGFTTLVPNKEKPNGLSQHFQIMPLDDILTAKDRTSPPGRAGLSTYYGHTLVEPNISEMLQVLEQAKQHNLTQGS